MVYMDQLRENPSSVNPSVNLSIHLPRKNNMMCGNHVVSVSQIVSVNPVVEIICQETPAKEALLLRIHIEIKLPLLQPTDDHLPGGDALQNLRAAR